MINVDNPPTRMRGKQASEYLETKFGIVRSASTLAKLRSVGGGPLYQKCNRWPLYRPQDLDDWAEQILSLPMRSTSDAVVVAPSGITPPTITADREPLDQSQHDHTKTDQDRAPTTGAEE